MVRLTKAQADMLSTCLASGAAWVTSRRENENLTLLRDWEVKGWAEETEAPVDFLIAFAITDLGRQALEAHHEQ